MIMTTMSEFLALIGKPRLNTIPLADYYGHTFLCACGYAHIFTDRVSVLCEGYLRLILVCPNNSHYLTNARTRIYSIEKYGGLEGAYGTQLLSSQDHVWLEGFMFELGK